MAGNEIPRSLPNNKSIWTSVLGESSKTRLSSSAGRLGLQLAAVLPLLSAPRPVQLMEEEL